MSSSDPTPRPTSSPVSVATVLRPALWRPMRRRRIASRALLALATLAALVVGVPSGASATIGTDPSPPPIEVGQSNFRTFCAFSHSSFDDPIVHPNQTGAAHQHFFFGNTAADAFSTPETLRTKGNSTCQGTRFNKSAYWMPAVFDGRGAPRLPDRTDIYYKHLADSPNSDVATLPAGLKIVAGDATGAPEQYQTIAYWRCNDWSFDVDRSDTIPVCQPGDTIRMSVNFPSCWDGRNLDAPDHQSHMAYIEYDRFGNSGCPATHPVAVPEISLQFEWGVRDVPSSGWYLSSDHKPDGMLPGGSTLHADWMNGWDQSILDLWTTKCIREERDCANGSLGDGRILDRLMALGSRRIPKARVMGQPGPHCNGRPATIVGTQRNDNIVGTSGDDVIQAFGGDDVIDGGGGFDIICAGGGADRVTGGSGDDEIWGGPDADVIDAGPGDDFVQGNGGDDVVEGGAGEDQLFGGPGADTLSGSDNGNLIHGGAGDDVLTGGYWADDLFGGRGDDSIDGVGNADRVWGGAGIDSCSPGRQRGCE